MLTLNSTRNGKPVIVDGQNLSIAAVTAASRYHASVFLDESPALKAKITISRKVMADKVDAGLSVYGVSTGFGGSADTRTDQPILLGNAVLQHQQSGVLPSSMKPLDVLPLQDPLSATSMPESWVRGAILIRMNSLIRGHSGVRWELIEKMRQLLRANITPLVPLYGTISASGGNYIHLNFISLLNRFSRPLPIILYCRNSHWQSLYSGVRRSRCLWRPRNCFFM
jgi:phenylalanine ammonia-lyase